MFKQNENPNEEEKFKQLNATLKQLEFINQLECHLGSKDKLTNQLRNELQHVRVMTQIEVLDSLKKIKKTP